jgi:glycosyltransferase involved in cell wall biosynthesis
VKSGLRLLYLQGVSYTSFQGGGVKGNRKLLEDLAARGHDVHVFLPCFERADDLQPRPQTVDDLVTAGIPFRRPSEDVVELEWNGVRVTGFLLPRDGDGRIDFSKLQAFVEAGRALAPDAIVVSNGHMLQRALMELALMIDPERLVAILHTVLDVMPAFGPWTVEPDVRLGDLFRAASRVVVVSEYLRDYLKQWGKVDATVMRFPFFGPGPWPELGRFDEGLVTMVNAGPLKGAAIFEDLAATMPHVAFGAVPSWDTGPEVLARLQRLPNVEIVPFDADVDAVFRRTRVLVAPSLLPEPLPIIVIEAMLRGIPVLAADNAGFREAKLGVEHLLPIVPAEYEQIGLSFSSKVPPQDARPWRECLERLLADEHEYRDLSRRSREAAIRYASEVQGAAFFEQIVAPLSRSVRGPESTRQGAPG